MINYIGKPINYLRINAALVYYQSLGYKYVEVPWLVYDFATQATIPNSDLALNVENEGGWHGRLIGSAEQGFVQMLHYGKLGYGRFVAASPCFRDEQNSYTEGYKQPHFFKVELIDTESGPATVERMIGEALRFNRTQGASKCEVKLDIYSDVKDIYFNHIEIGSYGNRSVDIQGKKHSWTYGTGVAEPRFSYALERSSEGN